MRLLIAGLAAVIVSPSLAWSKGSAPANPRTADVALARRAVPGATLLFPTGKVTRDEPGDETGKLQIQLGDGGRAQLGWTTGAPMSVAELDRTLVKPLQQAMRLSLAQQGSVRVSGSSGTRWVLRNQNGSMIVSVWSCGKREFHLIVVRQGEPPSELEQRIRDSFVCKSDPPREGNRTPPKAGTRLPREPG